MTEGRSWLKSSQKTIDHLPPTRGLFGQPQNMFIMVRLKSVEVVLLSSVPSLKVLPIYCCSDWSFFDTDSILVHPMLPLEKDFFPESVKLAKYKQCDGKANREACGCTDEQRVSPNVADSDCIDRVRRYTSSFLQFLNMKLVN